MKLPKFLAAAGLLLLLSSCKKNDTLWMYDFVNESKYPIYNVTIGNFTGQQLLADNAIASPPIEEKHLWFTSGIGSFIDPTWYLLFQYKSQDGKVHKKSFICLIPWRLWKEHAEGTKSMTIFFLIKDEDKVSAKVLSR
jgi:hypothetical protein